MIASWLCMQSHASANASQAPEGSVAKITGKEGLVFSGVAKVYDSEELMMAGLNRKEITKGFP